MEKVGIRDLKARLSLHLQRVREGVTLVVTDRGREVATISPVNARANTDWAWNLVRKGRAHWPPVTRHECSARTQGRAEKDIGGPVGSSMDA